MKSSRFTQHLIPVLVALPLVYALWLTFADWQAFQIKIVKAAFIPVALIEPITYFIPALEIAVIVTLIVPMLRKAGWLLNIVLHGLLSGYLLMFVIDSAGPPCGCGGIFPSFSIYQHLFLQLFLLCISIIFLPMKKQHKEPRPLSPFRKLA